MADYPEFELPVGVDVEDLKEGEEIEVLAKIRKKSDGKACLVEVEGFPLADKDDDDVVVVEEDDDEPLEDRMMNRINQLG